MKPDATYSPHPIKGADRNTIRPGDLVVSTTVNGELGWGST